MRYFGSLTGRSSSMGDSVYFLIAVSVVLIFAFPLYWGLSTSLRAPMDTFTVTGLGIPGIHFDPTLKNWLDQLVVPEMRKSIYNSIVISPAILVVSRSSVSCSCSWGSISLCIGTFPVQTDSEPGYYHMVSVSAGSPPGSNRYPFLSCTTDL